MESTTWRVVALWAAAVVVAVGASTAAVTLATDSVTQPPAVGLASPSDGTTPGEPTPSGDPSPTDAATAEPSPGVEDTDGSGDGTTAGSGTTPTTEDPSDEPSPVPSPRDDDTDDTDDDGTDDDDQSSTATGTCGDRGGESRSATSVGGQAGFCFVDGNVELVYATPSDDGFTVDVDDEAGEVRVTFTSDDHESRIDADYEDGQPRVRVREEAEDD